MAWMAKKAQWKLGSKLYPLYLRNKLKNLPRQALEQFEDVDPDDILRYLGLSTYKPGRVAFGGMGAFFLGALVGGVAALLLAPKSGPELRHEVKDKAMGYIGKQPGVGAERTASA